MNIIKNQFSCETVLILDSNAGAGALGGTNTKGIVRTDTTTLMSGINLRLLTRSWL